MMYKLSIKSGVTKANILTSGYHAHQGSWIVKRIIKYLHKIKITEYHKCM